MAILIKEYTYGFEDVSMVPTADSEVGSRKDVDTSYKMTEHITLQTPIIASPMADVCDARLAVAMAKAGAIGCIHRFQTIDDQVKMVYNVRSQGYPVFAAVGTDPESQARVVALAALGVDGIIVDVAFLNERTLNMCRWIKEKFPQTYLISGNVATAEGYLAGAHAGLDAIRVGIGNGQACRTSRVTGVGVGLVTSLMDCANQAAYERACGKHAPAIICDGGMDIGGSFCKALAAGADAAIMGRSFAATWEAPGKVFAKTTDFAGGQLGPYESMAEVPYNLYIELREHKVPIYKEYRGSASMEAQMTYKAAGDIITSEGVASLVRVFGSVADVLGRYNGALRSSMSYVGAADLDTYRRKAIFRLVGEGVFSQQKARGLQSREITI